jgi:hypothetical protein
MAEGEIQEVLKVVTEGCYAGFMKLLHNAKPLLAATPPGAELLGSSYKEQ